MALRLRAQTGQLPLIFETGMHLAEPKLSTDAFTVAGEPIAGSALNQQLAAEGFGPHQVTFSGKFVPAGGDIEHLIPWQKTVTLLGPLDAQGLARASYGVGKSLYGAYGKNDTPPELYVTTVTVGEPEKKKRPPKRFRAAYQDTKTGHFVSRDKYLHSRRQIRANAKRSGRSRPPKGRYVRVLIPL